ncbi:hypothetical protein GCM10010508_68170 [Streptomyces naganishii JCM 4654]|uniref:Uncharacterized protein n=1 Tax=Streptomyces naganishii JCM 4654 TaxID=1306179 RepID=A0A918YAM1_9ACTN|nr:hypothetical protein GCM10010508_68170 [Streptomyces naganishii JCM 4654]
MPHIVLEADFSSPRQWIAGRSWAYPDGGPVNPGDDKLDHLSVRAGRHHPPPDPGTTRMSYEVAHLVVERPGG